MALLKDPSLVEDHQDTVVLDAPREAPAAQVPVAAPPVSLPVAVYQGNAADFSAGLTLDFFSYPNIVLDQKGAKFVDNEKTVYGTEFECQVLFSRYKYVYRCEGNDIDTKKDLAYTYDQVNSVNGEPIEFLQARWDAEGKNHFSFKYRELTVTMTAPGKDWDGAIRMLQIAPKSVSRFDGVCLVARTVERNPAAEIGKRMRVWTGEQVGQGTKAFVPWCFKFV